MSQEQVHDWSTEQVSGFEQVTRDDLGVPFLAILQDGSPEVKKSHPKYQEKKIPGASPGDVINTQTREVIHKMGEEPMRFIPCGYVRLFVEWKDRDSGGGFVRQHNDGTILNQTRKNDQGRDVLPNGNFIQTTGYFFGLLVTGEGRHRAIIGMSSTQLKKARYWLGLAQSLKMVNSAGVKFTPPMFAREYLLSTAPENNAKGSWYGWKIESGEYLSEPKAIEDARETAVMARQGVGPSHQLEEPDEDGHKKDVPF